MPDVSVIIPTYHEQANLARLLPVLYDELACAGLVGEVIVVDDDSRDGTEELCSAVAESEALRLIVRRGERGLATAVLRGFAAAIGDVCVVMDADFSHPPKAIPELVAAIRTGGCDMAIGSRYVRGSAVDASWSWLRRVNSRVATLLARGLTDVADPMAGFFAIRQSTLARAAALRPIGYKIAIELIVRCDCRNVAEVPILFQDRVVGESKMSARQQWLYLRHLARLYAVRYLNRGRLPAPVAEPQRRAA